MIKEEIPSPPPGLPKKDLVYFPGLGWVYFPYIPLQITPPIKEMQKPENNFRE
jgi:hypothetical protein